MVCFLHNFQVINLISILTRWLESNLTLLKQVTHDCLRDTRLIMTRARAREYRIRGIPRTGIINCYADGSLVVLPREVLELFNLRAEGEILHHRQR